MIYILTFLISVILDQITKYYITASVKMHHMKPIIGEILFITRSSNTGGAFGIFSKHPNFFVVLAILLVSTGLILTKKIIKRPALFQLSAGLIVGGAAGNLIDRLRIGKVIDFIGSKYWATFNVADIAICVGVGLMIISLFKYEDGLFLDPVYEKAETDTPEKPQESSESPDTGEVNEEETSEEETSTKTDDEPEDTEPEKNSIERDEDEKEKE